MVTINTDKKPHGLEVEPTDQRGRTATRMAETDGDMSFSAIKTTPCKLQALL